MPWQPKTGAPSVVVLDSGAISLLLAAWPSLQYLAPTLAGEVIEIGAFCAAGPVEPPITMADIVWVGYAPNDGRPHTLLTVTRAIARAEAFAQYCEDPGNPTASWHTIADTCSLLEANGQDMVIWTGPLLPNSSTKLRLHYISGPFGDLHDAVTAGARHIEQTNIDTFGPGETGKLTGPQVTEGNTVEDDFSSWRSTNPTVPVWPAVYVGGGNNASGEPCCFTLEWWGPDAGGDYVPPDSDEDPDVDLPDGTGATLDQLEVKLDAIQQQLRLSRGANFGLDVSTLTGANDQVAGELGDAVGVLVLVQDRPGTRSSWSDDPPRYPRLVRMTFGNADGWFESFDLEHVENVILPLPIGATRYSLTCEPPMVATVTLYRPIEGPQ